MEVVKNRRVRNTVKSVASIVRLNRSCQMLIFTKNKREDENLRAKSKSIIFREPHGIYEAN